MFKLHAVAYMREQKNNQEELEGRNTGNATKVMCDIETLAAEKDDILVDLQRK